MVYLGVNSNNGGASSTAASSSAGQNKNGSRSPHDIVDLDTEKANERNGGPSSASSNGADTRDSNQIPVMRDSRDSRDDREDSGSEDDNVGKIRVGKDFQVITPNWVPHEQRRPEQCPERALLVWSPNPAISQTKLDEYIQVSKEKYGYNAEQALGMLFWHKHDLDRAIQDLANFTPFPDEWTVEDKVLFEQAFQFHGKYFRRIRQMMPSKSIAHLVKHYYSWKKTRAKTSLMDRQAKKLQIAREQQGYYEGSATAILNPDKPTDGNCNAEESTSFGVASCTVEVSSSATKNSDLTVSRASDKEVMKNNSRPPKGMYINHDDLVTMATGPNTQGEHLLKSMDREIVSYKRVVQNNKQLLSALHRRSRDRSNIEPYKIPTDITSRINAKWSSEELLLGVQGIRTFGKNFTAISEVIGTKTESHVRSFFVNYRRRYNLDTALKEYEAEHGPTPNDEAEMSENGIGKSGASSGTGTPRGLDSRSVSPVPDASISMTTGGSTTNTKKLEGSS